MIACDRNTGRRLLAGELAGPDESEFVDHLETCCQCRAWLEQDAGQPAAWESTRKLLSSSSEIVSWTDPGPGQQTREQSAAARQPPAIDISFLSPTDDPASLGRIGGYEVSGVIGRGGMGIVLKSVDRALSRSVAIKVLDPSLAGIGAARQRFAREVRAMAAISHEHVLPIYAVDEHQGLPYFAMEYVAGGTLESRLRTQGSLEVVSIVRIALQVAEALAAAHDSGLVHRDIKPANILLDPGTERVRVADFGLARISNDASFTRSGLVAGTPQYMSPEQVRGETCDGRSDLFSLGCVMYAMCTGHAPFRAETVYGAMHRIVHDTPRPVREQNPLVPDWLERFIERLLAKRPEERFESAREAAAILSEELAILQNPGAVAIPRRTWIRAAGPLRRQRKDVQLRRIAAIGLVSAILIALVTWLSWPVPQPRTSNNSPDGGEIESAGPATINVHGPMATASSLPSTAPLWDSDGLIETRRRAAALAASLYDDPNPPSFDPWPADVEYLRRRVEEIVKNGQ